MHTNNLKTPLRDIEENAGRQVWWHSPEIPAPRTWSQEDEKLKVILGYVTSSGSSWACETLSQKQNKDANSQKGVSRLWTRKLSVLKCQQCSAWRTESMQSHPKSRRGLRLFVFPEIEDSSLKFIWNLKRLLPAKTISKNEVEDLTLPEKT